MGPTNALDVLCASMESDTITGCRVRHTIGFQKESTKTLRGEHETSSIPSHQITGAKKEKEKETKCSKGKRPVAKPIRAAKDSTLETRERRKKNFFFLYQQFSIEQREKGESVVYTTAASGGLDQLNKSNAIKWRLGCKKKSWLAKCRQLFSEGKSGVYKWWCFQHPPVYIAGKKLNFCLLCERGSRLKEGKRYKNKTWRRCARSTWPTFLFPLKKIAIVSSLPVFFTTWSFIISTRERKVTIRTARDGNPLGCGCTDMIGLGNWRGDPEFLFYLKQINLAHHSHSI